MKEVLDDFSMPQEKATNKKIITAFVLLLIMLIGRAFYTKYVNVTGSRADLSVLTIATLALVLFCFGLSLISVLIGRLFSSNKKELVPINSKLFWLDRIIGGFINWSILMLLVLAGQFL